MARYLLDTNILSDLIRNPQGKIRDRIAEVGEGSICTSIIVSSELRFGARKRGAKKLFSQMEAVLSTIEILPFEAPSDSQYAILRCALESAGTPIGPNDLFIAAQAVSLGLILVTANFHEFSRVPGLAVENWLA